ncbi:cyclic nucleotide-binding domain-containing protein [Magnetospirillum moscoviense]|uniref:Protein kinase n=1 Tax=Magnetospirillum moscoviense TaxID=1437059 RepID=A0A178N0G1_9PROT|nr:cyclic nucleotide-binding domain-containing protein [Magnetospirillum moscoviense]OAN60934.1 protein kinase [Magnetospirillum moscoviense]
MEISTTPSGEARRIHGDDLQIMARVPLFAGLTPEALVDIAGQSQVSRVPRGATLFRQGDAAKVLHVLLEGQVALMAGVEGGGEQTMLEILDSGESFIAAALLTGKPYLMSAMALAPCRLMEIPRDALLTRLRANPDLALAMLASLSRHFRLLIQEVKDLKLKSASQRLALYLMGLTQRRRGSVTLRLPHNKGLIAARVGVRPETLSRAFAHLKGQGVGVDGQMVTIADLARLGRYCHEGREIV